MGETVACGAAVTAGCEVGVAAVAGPGGSRLGADVGATLAEAVVASEITTFIVASATDATARIARASHAGRRAAASDLFSLK